MTVLKSDFVYKMEGEVVRQAVLNLINAYVPLGDYGISAGAAYEAWLIRMRATDSDITGYMIRRDMYQETFGSLATSRGVMYESIGHEIENRLIRALTFAE